MFRIISSVFLGFLEPLAYFVTETRQAALLLECFHFELQNGKLIARAQGNDRGIKRSITISSNDKGLRICVPARILLETLRLLNEEEITVSIKATCLVLHTSNGAYTIACHQVDEYPKFPQFPQLNSVGKVSTLVSLLSKVVYATSSDDLRMSMNGVLIYPKKSTLDIVATDGNRLVRCITTAVNKSMIPSRIILHRSLVQVLKSLSRRVDSDLYLAPDGNTIFFKLNDLDFYFPVIDESFPAYEAVLPKYSDPSVMKIGKTVLDYSVSRSLLFTEGVTKAVILESGNEGLKVQSKNDIEGRELGETLPCEHSGKGFRIAFNAKLFLEMIREVPGDQVTIKVNTSGEASWILGESDGRSVPFDYSSILMPVDIR